MTGTLKGQAAIITGGGRGFGRAIAEALAAEGASVTVTARSKAQLDETVAMIEKAGGRALGVAGDVTEVKDVAKVVKAAEKAFGPTSILVNNAGVNGPFGPVWAVDPEEWWYAQEVHVKGCFLFMNAVMGGMVERGRGTVINVASIAANVIDGGFPGYCTAKNTICRLTEHTAAAAAQHGVGVFSIEPGTVITELGVVTLASPEAKRWVPHLVEILKNAQASGRGDEDLARCGALCVKLSTGKYNALSGKFIDVREDLQAKLRDAQKA